MFIVFTQPIVHPETTAYIVERGDWMFATRAHTKLAELAAETGIDHVPGILWCADQRTLEVILNELDSAVAA